MRKFEKMLKEMEFCFHNNIDCGYDHYFACAVRHTVYTQWEIPHKPMLIVDTIPFGDDSVERTARFIDDCRKAKVKKFVLTESSTAVKDFLIEIMKNGVKIVGYVKSLDGINSKTTMGKNGIVCEVK